MLISDEYQAEQQRLHDDRPDYGVQSVKYAPMVSDICNKANITDLLDYGCGKGRLFKNLKVDHRMKLQAYDPGVERFSGSPMPSEMVACIDVLEHIEPDYLDNVLDDLQRLTVTIGFFTVHTGPAAKVLSDGRNAHLTQEGPEWWLPKFFQRWDVDSFKMMSPVEFFVICFARKPEATNGLAA